jgi:hypothetical protein
MFHS